MSEINLVRMLTEAAQYLRILRVYMIAMML